MKKLIFIGILALTFSSCSDFIEEDSRSYADAESTYTTAEGFNLLVNANYGMLREIYGDDAYVFCAGTDLYAVGSGRGSEPDGLSQYTQLNSSSEGVDQLYTSCYKAIRAANTALYYSDITEQTSDLSTLVGEVKYLRANAYFVLVQTYGGVSLVTDYVDDAPVLSFDRNSSEEVYDLIIQDLLEALDAVEDGSYSGRVTKRAVQHLLAKVYLTRAYEDYGASTDFETAAAYADDAIAGQALTIPFDELWFPGNEMNAETIFSVQFSPESQSTDPTGLGHKQANWYSSYLGGTENIDEDTGVVQAPWRSYTLLATEFALELFTEEDERYPATFMIEAFEDYYDAFREDDTSDLDVNHYYAPQWVTQTELDAYTLAHPEAQIHEWGTYAAGVVSSDYQTIPSRKFDDPDAPFENNARVSTRDLILSRLGETYLIAAEAYLQTNAAIGLQRLNEVRNRAGLDDIASYDIDELLDERARELFGEYHRWFDLKRTGKLVERASLHNYLIEESNFNGANGELKILRPIPQSALDLNQNSDFPQNPAYN